MVSNIFGRPQLSFNYTHIVAGIRDRAIQEVVRVCEELAPEIRQQANKNIQLDFNNNRTGRRRKGNARHLAGSIRSRVQTRPGRFPEILFWSTNDPAKFAALEFGSRPHSIYASDGRFVYFPAGSPGDTSVYTSGGYLKPGPKGGRGLQLAKIPIGVWHPGTDGRHFLEDAIHEVILRKFG